MPIAAMLPLPAGIAWFVISWACLVLTVRWIGRRLTSLPPVDWPLTQIPAIILCGAAIFEQCHFNQLSFLVLALAAASFALLRRGQSLAAGLVLAGAALIKLVPIVFVLWWVIRGRWRATLGVVLGVLLLDVGLTWRYLVRRKHGSTIAAGTTTPFVGQRPGDDPQRAGKRLSATRDWGSSCFDCFPNTTREHRDRGDIV